MDIPLGETVINKDVFRHPALKSKARQEAKVKSKEQHREKQMVFPGDSGLGTFLFPSLKI